MDFKGAPSPTSPATPNLASPRQRARVPVLTVLTGEMSGRLFRLESQSAVIGRLPECEIQFSDSGVSRMHARLEVSSIGVVVVDLGSTNGTFVNGKTVTHQALKDGDKVQIGSVAVLRFNRQDELDQAFHRQQFEKMTRDPLTGCHNRLYFDEELRREMAFAQRKDAHLSLALVDVDHFKRVNDTHGHGVGDAVLRRLSELLYKHLRTYDVLGRYGGEEFVALLRDAELAGAAVVAERLRSSVASQPFVVDGVPIAVTVSIGVASATELRSNDPQTVMHLADQRLYAAKAGGRNRVVSTGNGGALSATQPVDRDSAMAAISARLATMGKTAPHPGVPTDPRERDIELAQLLTAPTSTHAQTIHGASDVTMHDLPDDLPGA